MPDGTEVGELMVLFERKHKRWVVRSRDLAAHTAHAHYNILGAVRLAETEMEADGQRSTVIWGHYRARNQRWLPACQIPREVLERVRLHNVAGCRHVHAVLAEYLRLLAEREPEPAPDTEIRPPDPEPADTLAPVPLSDQAELGRWDVSWQITNAVELLIKHGAPTDAMQRVRDWNNDRQWQELQKRAKSWTQVHAIFANATPGGAA